MFEVLQAICISKGRKKEDSVTLDKVLFVFITLMLSTPLVTSGYYCDDKQYTWTTTVLTGSGVSGLKGALTVKGRGSRG